MYTWDQWDGRSKVHGVNIYKLEVSRVRIDQCTIYGPWLAITLPAVVLSSAFYLSMSLCAMKPMLQWSYPLFCILHGDAIHPVLPIEGSGLVHETSWYHAEYSNT